MANFAYIQNNEIDSVYDYLPDNWNNISNFYALESDMSTLNSLGWYAIQKIIPNYDPNTQKIDYPTQYIDNGVVYETYQVIDLPVEPTSPPPPLVIEPTPEELLAQQWTLVRQQRDLMILAVDWRITRYNRQVFLGITPVDDIIKLQTYIQALADVPEKNSDPFNINWPVLEE